MIRWVKSRTAQPAWEKLGLEARCEPRALRGMDVRDRVDRDAARIGAVGLPAAA